MPVELFIEHTGNDGKKTKFHLRLGTDAEHRIPVGFCNARRSASPRSERFSGRILDVPGVVKVPISEDFLNGHAVLARITVGRRPANEPNGTTPPTLNLKPDTLIRFEPPSPTKDGSVLAIHTVLSLADTYPNGLPLVPPDGSKQSRLMARMTDKVK